jgi:hypothetical protein
MKFIREASLDSLTPEILLELVEKGFILKYKGDTIEIWADVSPDAIEG